MPLSKKFDTTFFRRRCFFFMNIFRIWHIFLVMQLVPHMMVSAQLPHPILRIFEGKVVEGQVRLNWIINGGNTCEGIRIQRSENGSFFTTIGEIEGVCGSPDADVPYVFVDEDPLSYTESYYRLELGTQGYSTPVAIEYIPFNSDGYSVRVDAATRQAIVDFDNASGDKNVYRLLALNGMLLSQGQSRESQIRIDLGSYPGQIMLLVIDLKANPVVVKIPGF